MSPSIIIIIIIIIIIMIIIIIIIILSLRPRNTGLMFSGGYWLAMLLEIVSW